MMSAVDVLEADLNPMHDSSSFFAFDDMQFWSFWKTLQLNQLLELNQN